MFTLAYCKPIHYSDKTKKAIYIYLDKCTLIHFDPHFFIGLAGCLVTFHLRGGPQFSTGATFHIYIYIFDRNFSNILNLGKKWALVYFLYIENLKIEYKLQTNFSPETMV